MADEGTKTAAPSLGERLGWRSERRPVAGFAHILAAGAGLFLVIAAIALSVEIASDDLTVPGVLASLLVAALAIVGGMRLPGPARSACVTALATIVPVLWFFVFFGDGESAGDGAIRGVLLLCLAVYAVLYVLGWTAGRAIFLGLALVFLVGWINFEVGGGSSVAPFQNEVSGQTGFETPFTDGGSSTGFDDVSSDNDDTDIVSVVLGLAFLGAAFALDKKGRAGSATPFLAVGAVLAVVGAAALGGREGVLLGALLAAAAGADIAFVGASGKDRRGAVWFGGIVVTVGLLAAIADLADSPLGLAGLAALVAVALTALGIVVAPKLGESIDGDGAAAT